MVECPKCKNQYKDHITYCVFCGLDLVPIKEEPPVTATAPPPVEKKQEFFFEDNPPEEEKGFIKAFKSVSPPLSIVFALLGICSLIGGFAYAIHLWPETFRFVYGFIPSSACFPSFLAMLLGIIACCMCFAMAQIISSLKSLEVILFQIINKE